MQVEKIGVRPIKYIIRESYQDWQKPLLFLVKAKYFLPYNTFL
jgi:hypothetical protein